MQDMKRFSELPEYAFPRLRRLLFDKKPGGEIISMHLGEPKHPFPNFINDGILKHLGDFSRYPPNEGSETLRIAIGDWIKRRNNIKSINHETQILPLNGTREGLFNATIALSKKTKYGKKPMVLLPNPFYQCYAAAAKAIDSEPVFIPTPLENGFFPDFDAIPDEILNQATICYLCSPSNPQGAIASPEYLFNLINIAEKFDFIILSDECYSEIYYENKPMSALKACSLIGGNPERVITFNSLSKRSNLPGLRSGFAAGGERAISEMRKLKSYGGAPIPLPLQYVSTLAWQDETHVVENRILYSKKINHAKAILNDTLGFKCPEAGFFIWLPVRDGEKASVDLWTRFGVKVLPGLYLSKENHEIFGAENPGKNYIRIALVEPERKTVDGLEAIAKSCPK